MVPWSREPTRRDRRGRGPGGLHRPPAPGLARVAGAGGRGGGGGDGLPGSGGGADGDREYPPRGDGSGPAPCRRPSGEPAPRAGAPGDRTGARGGPGAGGGGPEGRDRPGAGANAGGRRGRDGPRPIGDQAARMRSREMKEMAKPKSTETAGAAARRQILPGFRLSPLGLRWKFLALVSLLLAVLLGLPGVYLLRNLEHHFSQELSSRGDLTARLAADLSVPYLGISDPASALDPLLAGFFRDKQVQAISLTDLKGQVIWAKRAGESQDPHRSSLTVVAAGTPLARIEVAMSAETIRQRQRSLKILMVLQGAVVTFALGLGLWIMFSRLPLRPAGHLHVPAVFF